MGLVFSHFAAESFHSTRNSLIPAQGWRGPGLAGPRAGAPSCEPETRLCPHLGSGWPPEEAGEAPPPIPPTQWGGLPGRASWTFWNRPLPCPVPQPTGSHVRLACLRGWGAEHLGAAARPGGLAAWLGARPRAGETLAGPLQDYMDPMNEFSALNEAKQMIAVADENQNHYLEPEEVLKYSEFFTGSKLVDYARSVHEEF